MGILDFIIFLIVAYYIGYGIYYLIVVDYKISGGLKKLERLKLEKVQEEYKEMLDLFEDIIINEELPHKITDGIEKISKGKRLQLENLEYILKRYREQQLDDWDENDDAAIKSAKENIKKVKFEEEELRLEEENKIRLNLLMQ